MTMFLFTSDTPNSLGTSPRMNTLGQTGNLADISDSYNDSLNEFFPECYNFWATPQAVK